MIVSKIVKEIIRTQGKDNTLSSCLKTLLDIPTNHTVKMTSSDRYIATDGGLVYRITKYELKLVGNKNQKGYMFSSALYLEFGTPFVHRIVAKTFIPNTDGKPDINHLNGVKDDNRTTNLEWCTSEENIIHAQETGLSLRNPRSTETSLTPIEACQVIALYIKGTLTNKQIAELYGIPVKRLRRITTSQTMRNVHTRDYAKYVRGIDPNPQDYIFNPRKKLYYRQYVDF